MIKLINQTRVSQQRTPSGKSWSTKNIEISNKVVSWNYYNTFIDSIPAFNRVGYCRGKRTYTEAGFLITETVTISPQRDTKYIDRFNIILLDQEKLIDNMGYREREIYNNMDYFKEEYHNQRRYIVFYQGNASFMLDANNYKIVN